MFYLWSLNTATEGQNVSYPHVSYTHCTCLCTHLIYSRYL